MFPTFEAAQVGNPLGELKHPRWPLATKPRECKKTKQIPVYRSRLLMLCIIVARISTCSFSLSRLHRNSYRCTGVLVPGAEPLVTVRGSDRTCTFVKRLLTQPCHIPKVIPSFLFFFFADNCSHLLCFPGFTPGRRHRVESSHNQSQ